MKPMKEKVSAITMITFLRKSKNQTQFQKGPITPKKSNELSPEMPTGMSFRLLLATRIDYESQFQGNKAEVGGMKRNCDTG